MVGGPMGALLFWAAVVVEVALLVRSLTRRSYATSWHSFVRVGALAAFALLAGIGVVEWGPRYYAFAALLTLLALGSLVRPDRPFRPWLAIAWSVTLSLLLLLAALPAILFPQGAQPLATTGAFAVRESIATLTDASRTETYGASGGARTVTVGFWYPAGEDAREGAHPLVVFSHGSLGVLTSNESLYRELASHGYVVASVGHTYLALYVTAEGGSRTWLDLGYLRDLRGENASADPQASFELYRQWMGVRIGDIGFVIDSLVGGAGSAAATALAPAATLIDPERIGVMGHSLGGSAALGIGRERADVSAVLALEAPLLWDIVGVAGGAFVLTGEPYPVPVFNLYSDDTWGRLGELPQYAANLALLGRSEVNAFDAHVAGSKHLGMTDLALSSPLLTRLLGGGRQSLPAEAGLRDINRLALEFFDVFLKGE